MGIGGFCFFEICILVFLLGVETEILGEGGGIFFLGIVFINFDVFYFGSGRRSIDLEVLGLFCEILGVIFNNRVEGFIVFLVCI